MKTVAPIDAACERRYSRSTRRLLRDVSRHSSHETSVGRRCAKRGTGVLGNTVCRPRPSGIAACVGTEQTVKKRY